MLRQFYQSPSPQPSPARGRGGYPKARIPSKFNMAYQYNNDKDILLGALSRNTLTTLFPHHIHLLTKLFGAVDNSRTQAV